VVESGQVTAEGNGLTGRYGTGIQIVVPTGAHVTVRNPGPSGALLLRLLVRSSASAATPSSIRSGTPAAVEAVPNVLVAAEVPRLAGRRGTMFIVRATLPPGTTTDSLFFNGPVALAVESGTLVVEGETGTPLNLQAGRGFLVPAFTASTARNSTVKPAVVLVA